jgi:hypothetical protein
MTATQRKAAETIKAMKFKVEKQNRWDEQATEQKCKEQPAMAIILQEQLEDRIRQRNEAIDTFYQLLREATKLADWYTGLYQGFRSNCVAKDPLNYTDEELDHMSTDEIIICGHAQQWRSYFPDLTTMQAVCMALIYGCAHANALEHIRTNQQTQQKEAA